MTLGAEEEKQFHSRFPFSRPLIPSPLILRSRSISLSLSLSLFVFFRPTLVTRAPRLRFEHERELG